MDLVGSKRSCDTARKTKQRTNPKHYLKAPSSHMPPRVLGVWDGLRFGPLFDYGNPYKGLWFWVVLLHAMITHRQNRAANSTAIPLHTAYGMNNTQKNGHYIKHLSYEQSIPFSLTNSFEFLIKDFVEAASSPLLHLLSSFTCNMPPNSWSFNSSIK